MLVLLSYVPLLRGLPGRLVEAAEIAPLLETDAGHVEAIVWTLGEGGAISPMLAMDRADEVFEHLVEWSEGAPATWFKIHVDENDDEYALAMVPDVHRSLDRFLLARTLVAGADASSHDEVRVVFRPLLFRGPTSDASRRVLPLLRDAVTVGFLDARTLSAGLDCLDPHGASHIGPLRCERDPGLLSRT